MNLEASAETGGHAIVRALGRHQVKDLFGLPGIQLDALYCALHDAGQALRVYHFRHEQGAAYAALGYAQASGRPGVYCVVPGPGFLNTTAALSTAYATGAPVLALIGQMAVPSIGQGWGELHEIPDQSAVLRSLTRWSGLARTPAQVGPLMDQAFDRLAQGPCGPVGLELPPDVLSAPASPQVATAPVQAVAIAAPDERQIEQAVALLSAARSPLIVAGGGALHAGRQLQELSRCLQAPVGSHRQARGVLDTEDPYSLNLYEVSQRWRDADVILAVGTRLHFPRKVWGLRAGQRLIQIDLDAARVQAGGRPDVFIQADAQAALQALLQALPAQVGQRPSIAGDLSVLKAASRQAFEQRLAPQMAYLRAIRNATPDDAVFVADYTQIAYVATAMLPVKQPRLLLTPGYQGTLGFGYATALGAQVARAPSPVVALCGDGGFLFTATEMATAMQHDIPVVAVVFNDGAYNNVQRMQRELYGNRVISTDLRNPDFVAMAGSFGMDSQRVDSPEALEPALRQAVQNARPALIEVAITRFLPDPWPLLAPRLG